MTEIKRFVRPTLLLSLLLFCGLVTATPVLQAGLIVNGDFESGNTGFSTDYSYITSPFIDPGEYAIVTETSSLSRIQGFSGDHTSGSGLMMMVDSFYLHSGDSPLLVWSQTVNVRQNASYDFSGWVASWTSASDLNPAILDIRVNGTSLQKVTAPSSRGNWIEFTASWNSVSASSAVLEIYEIGGQDEGQPPFGGHDFALDDLVFEGPASEVVPEPSSLAIFGIGALGMAGIGRRRKQKQAA